jgi:hypothetical protein
MARPESASDWPKYFFWRLYTPLHPLCRGMIQRLGVTSASFVEQEYPGRQDYLLGTIAPGQTSQAFISYLIEQGFGKHFVAWHDEGELASLRYSDGFRYQYHLRVFKDGEVRGHYEYTPECYPLKHLKGVGRSPRHDHFLQLLGDRIVPADSER